MNTNVSAGLPVFSRLNSSCSAAGLYLLIANEQRQAKALSVTLNMETVENLLAMFSVKPRSRRRLSPDLRLFSDTFRNQSVNQSCFDSVNVLDVYEWASQAIFDKENEAKKRGLGCQSTSCILPILFKFPHSCAHTSNPVTKLNMAVHFANVGVARRKTSLAIRT